MDYLTPDHESPARHPLAKGRGFRKSCISISLLADANVARDLRNLKQLGDWLLPVLGGPRGGEIEAGDKEIEIPFIVSSVLQQLMSLLLRA